MSSKIAFLQNIKVIVLIGYFLLFLLALFGGYQVFRQMVKFSQMNDTRDESRQLNLISNALVTLYETESMRKVMFSEDVNTFSIDSAYFEKNSRMHLFLDSLYNSTNDKNMHLSLDSVNIFLDEKESNFLKISQLVDSIRKLPYSQKVLTTVLTKNDIDGLYDIFETNYTQQVSDSSFYIKKKKGFFSKLKDVFIDSKDSTKVISKQNIQHSDSTYKKSAQLLTDTIVQFINDISFKNDRRKALYLAKLSMRQEKMIHFDELLTNQIHLILSTLEIKERKQIANQLIERENAISKSSKIASLIALTSLFIVVIFIILTLTLLNKSQEYRNKLEKSKQYTEDLLKSRERLLLMISHDIKSPLSSIIGHIELLSKEKMPEKEKLYVDNIRNSSEHILELVNKLMEYHKLEEGKSETNNLSFLPHRLMTDIYQSFVPIAQPKGLTYISQNNIDAYKVFESDPFIIKQISNNLISNALKFTSEGKVKLSSTIIDDDKLYISVKDSGIGIKPEDRPKIFDEFQRIGDSDKKQNIEGHGLGLAITYKLVKLLNGKIDVKSEYGKGSEFMVTIPVKLTKQSTIASHSTENNNSLKNIAIKVLFVDDDIAMLNVYKKLLEREGGKVTTCSDSKMALQLLKKENFDIILTDIQMPLMNGFELVSQIRAMGSEHYSKIPIIALSARSDISQTDLIEAGFSSFLPKPVSFKILSEKICGAISPTLQTVTIDTQNASPRSQTLGIGSMIEFIEDDKDIAVDILQVFISENKIKIEELQEALQTEDWLQIKATSHKLLPLMRMIGANEIVKISETLENGNIDSNKVKELIKMVESKNIEIIRFLKEKFDTDI